MWDVDSSFQRGKEFPPLAKGELEGVCPSATRESRRVEESKSRKGRNDCIFRLFDFRLFDLSTPSPPRLPLIRGGIVVVVAILFTFRPALADVGHDHGGTKRVQMSQHRSLSDTRNTWPSSEKLWRVVTLRDYNTRMVFLGTLLLGVCAGLVGTFTLIRKRALVGDVVGHAALPGVRGNKRFSGRSTRHGSPPGLRMSPCRSQNRR